MDGPALTGQHKVWGTLATNVMLHGPSSPGMQIEFTRKTCSPFKASKVFHIVADTQEHTHGVSVSSAWCEHVPATLVLKVKFSKSYVDGIHKPGLKG